MNNIYKHVLVASLLMVGGTAMAQTLNSAYFTEDYKFRHDMNPAFENKQNYISIPALGNINVNLQGNFGYQDVVMHNPMYGQEAGAKKMTTFTNVKTAAIWLKDMKANGTVTEYNKYNAVADKEAYWLVIYDSHGDIAAVLTDGKQRRNAATQKPDHERNYPNCAALCVKFANK